MPKIRLRYIAIILILIIIAGCKGECKVNSDCPQKTCYTPQCIDKKCSQKVKTSCCGNGVEEQIENGKPGNKCTCPADYGVCEGKGKIKRGTREYDTTYLQYICKNDECIFGINPEDVRPIKLIDEKETSFFKLETVISFNEPFDLKNDVFDMRFTLKDASEDLSSPLKTTKITLMQGEVFFGEKNVNKELEEAGDIISETVALSYEPEQIEEEKSLSYKIDYEHNKKVKFKGSSGEYEYREELVRDSFTKSFNSDVFFVKTG